jgi:tetratricopeptide (TPR) repeat protein
MNKIKKLIDEVHSEEIKLLIEQGNQLADLKKFEEAFEFYEKGLKVTQLMETPDVKNKDLIKTSYKIQLINKAKIEVADRNYDNAIEVCKRALELDEIYVEAYFQIGEAYSGKRKYDIAIENYQRAVDFDKKHISSWNSMGLAYKEKKNYEEALRYLEKAVQIDPSYSQGWFNKGNVYKLKGEFDNAIESYIKATKIDEDYAIAWLFLGSAYFDKKDFNNAITNIEKAIKIDPNLAHDMSPLIKNFKNTIEKLGEVLSLSFINK